MLTFASGEVYSGGFLDDNYHGYGVYTSASGAYEGEYDNGVRQGKGKYSLASGDVYEGLFHNGVFHGQGGLLTVLDLLWTLHFTDTLFLVYTFADGQTLEGTFENGNYVG